MLINFNLMLGNLLEIFQKFNYLLKLSCIYICIINIIVFLDIEIHGKKKFIKNEFELLLFQSTRNLRQIHAINQKTLFKARD
jgi:hypothetical protein